MGFPARQGVVRGCPEDVPGCSRPVPGFAGILARALSDTLFIHT